jgi:hypothetical protein
MPLYKIIDMMADVSPEISRGIWDFLRMVNPGWKLKVYKLDTETAPETPAASRAKDPEPPDDSKPKTEQAQTGNQEREEDAASSEYLNAFMAQLRELYGSPNVVINKLILGGFLRGGFLAEMILDAGASQAVDLATPDPRTLDWRQVEDPIRGRVWQFGQYQGSEFVTLSVFPTIKYVPIDALPGKPYGRAPVHPALFPTLFLISLLRDLKRVVSQQGYPRIDLAISVEKITAAFADKLPDDPDALKDVIEKIITEVTSVFSSLEPDDAYVHTDMVTVNKPVGAVDSSSLGAVDKLVLILERMMVRALKTMPLLMAVAEGTSEANANRQWEIYSAAIKSVQELVQSLLEGLFSVALRAAGLQGVVEFRFEQLRASEEMRDAQTEKLRIDNAKAKYNAGWITQDEASIEVTGHPAAEEEPRLGMLNSEQQGSSAGVANPLTAQPEPGENRELENLALLWRMLMKSDADRMRRNATVTAAIMTTPLTEPAAGQIAEASEYWDRNVDDPDAKGIVNSELETE